MATQGRIERRLAAILAADVAGYSRLMGADEAGTARALREHRAAIDPIVASYGGRIVKTTGDGVLLEFPSIVAAVECAIAVQKLMAERNADVPDDRRMLFRIGINLGDVLIEGDDILGDGVNIAARLEGIAEPGGICVSDDAHRQVRGKLGITFEDAGEQQLKNIARPVRVYRVQARGAAVSPRPTLPLPDKPSIAVLPFQNMSGDPEQEYFADGIVEEIITALSRFRHLFVIARNSTFTYKGRAVDVKQVGRELGVRYIVEGSVRKAGNHVRITGQLVDALTGAHLWADRFDGTLQSIFDLQDRVTERVVGAISPKLEQAETERAKRKPTESLDAYDYYLRGIASLRQETKIANEEALRLFHRAIELDPDFASAYSMAATCYSQRKLYGWRTDRKQEIAEARRLARRAVELGEDDAEALARAGHVLSYVVHEIEAAATIIDRALTLNPNYAYAWFWSGDVRWMLGEPDLAIEHLMRAMRMNPLDRHVPMMQSSTAYAFFFAGRYDEASSWAEKALRQRPNYVAALRLAAASHALAGRLEEAHKAMSRALEIDPMWHLSHVKKVALFRRPGDRAKWEEGLRKAGLPE
jgi:TolB-like protein/Flp pilus assembly protein TadD